MDFGTVTVDEDALDALATMAFPQDGNKRGPHARPMCFICDTGDLFHESVPSEFIYYALNTLSLRTDVDWQVLTKRPERARYLLQGNSPLPPNIWLGVTVENNRNRQRIEDLLNTPAAVRFVSGEPMLEPVDLHSYLGPVCGEHYCEQCGDCLACYGGDRCYESSDGKHAYPPFLSWVICGAESGPHRRPFDVAWALDLYQQCREAGVPFFGKQASGQRPGVPLELPGFGVVQEWPKEATE
jgi:protein gp37